MKTLSLLLVSLLSLSARADRVSLHRIAGPGVTVYAASANLSRVYDEEMAGREERISDEFTLENRQRIADFDKIHFSPLGADLGAGVLDQLQKGLIADPVAGRGPRKVYDQQNGQVGFCYGRALLVQKQLERLGVNPGRIFKVFLLGELSQNGVLWDYHVATLYVNHRGEKLLIDSLHDRVLPLADWYTEMHRYFLNPVRPKVRVYFAEADKFQARPGRFTPGDVFDPLYGGFFFDLALWL